jgi:hypothetical protein
VASGSAAFASGLVPARAVVPETSLRDKLSTRAEASNFTESSSNEDVHEFLAMLDERGAPIFRSTFGKTAGGRDIPFVVSSRPLVRTPAEARALNRPIVFVQATVDAGSVEGKEAALALLRDLCLSTEKTLLDDLVLVFVPVYNPDGNAKMGPVSSNAPYVNGPARVGTAFNGAGLDLSVDFVKADAPETRAALALLRDWNPDVFVDLRTSGLSFVDVATFLAPALHPAAFYGGAFARDSLLPAVRKEMHEKFGFETFLDGHFGRRRPLAVPPTAPGDPDFGWFPIDYRPRTGLNYMGLRGAVACAIAAYAHDPLERRVYTTRACLESVLGFCSDSDDDVLENSRTASRWIGGSVPVRAGLPQHVNSRPIDWEVLALSSGVDGEPGVPVGFKRTGTFTTTPMPLYDRYVASLIVPLPNAYLIPYEHSGRILPLLHAHGIAYDTGVATQKVHVQEYVIDRIDRAAFPYEERHLVGVVGHWEDQPEYVAKFGAITIPAVQPGGPLVNVLLEPQSDDGFLAWDTFGDGLQAGFPAPVRRVV